MSTIPSNPQQKEDFDQAQAAQRAAAGPVAEKELAAAAVAPRITPADIEASIASEHYFTAADGVNGAEPNGCTPPGALQLLTFCVLVLSNGFTVTGESACASPANFNADFGRRLAREAAVRKLWPLLGFRLRDKLAAQAAG